MMNKNVAFRYSDKTKPTIIEEMFAKIIQSTLHFQKQLIFNRSVQIIVLFVCNFQILFFGIYQDYQWQVSTALYSDILTAIFRTDILLSKYEISFQFIIYLILCLIVGQKFLMVYCYQNKNSSKLRIIQYFFQTTVSIYVQLFFNFLLIPFTTLNSLAIIYQYNQLQNNNLSYVQIIFGILIFIIVQTEALIHLLINQQSIDTKIVCFEKLRITPKDFLIYVLNMISVIVFSLGDSVILHWILHILIFLSSFLTIQNQLEAQGIIHKFQKNIIYFGHSFSLTYVFFSAIKIISDSSSFNNLLFTFFGFPIVLQIVHSIDSEIKAYLFYNALNKQNINMHAISQLLIQQSNNVKLPKMLKIYIFNQHKSKCRDSHCFCHHDKLIADPHDTAPITLNIQQDFALVKLKLFRKQLFLNDKAYLDELIFYTVIYGSLLANYGWIIQSVKHFNQLLFGKQQHSKNSQSSVNQSIMAPSSFSQTIRNDSSSQSISDPEKKYAEVSFKNLQKQQKHILTYSLKLDFIQTQKILFLLDSIKVKLKNIFGGQQLTSEQHDLSEHIQVFMQQEFKMENYLNEIKKILQLKIKYFESSIQLLKKISISESMKQIQNICRTLMSFQAKLHLEYERYPSKRLLSLQVFYEAEVFKNYLQAYKLINQATMSDNQLFILGQNFQVNFYTNHVSYLLFTVNDDLQHIDILQQSSNFKKIVDYSMNEEFDFKSLLLQFIVREHPILVSRFFKTGKSKYYKQFSQTFIKNKRGIAKPIIFSFDNISQLKFDRIALVGIFQEVEIEFSFIMVDVNYVLGGMTKSFLLMLGFDPELVDNITDFSQFYKLKISRIFPQFEELVDNELSLIRANNVETRFIDLEMYLGIILQDNSDSYQKQLTPSHQLWENQKFLKCYQSNITIHKNELYGYHYYVISIDSIIQNQTRGSLSKTEQLTTLKGIRRDLTEESENFELSQLNLSIGEAMPRTINLFTIKSREGYSQRHMSLEKNINLFEVKEIYHEDLLEKNELQIISPNKSTSQLIEKQQHKLLQSQQQDYFTNNTSQKQIKIEFNAKIDNQLVEKGKDTKILTEYGYLNSQLLNKFSLINDITKEKEPKMLKYLLSVILIILAIQFICPLLAIFILNEDILQFISNIEMISFHASIQGPHDLFFMMRNTITVYQQMQREGFVSSSILTSLTEPYYLHIGLGYTELRDSLYHQLNNQYLENFLDDEQMTLLYMKNDQTTVYEVGPEKFRECLLQILQYQYAQMRTFEKRQSTSGQPYQIFLFANYYNIQDKLETITNSILQYTINESSVVSQKWMIIWIIFSISLLIVLLVGGVAYHNYLKSYDEFLKLLSFIDKPQAQLEIEKLQQLISVLNGNQDYSYSYKFDLQHQEQFMKNCIELNKIQKSKKQDNEQQYESSRKNSFIFWVLIAAIFLTYVLIIEMKNEDYLSKFDETTKFYFLIQNLKFRSGCLFLYREHLLRWSNFTFLTSYDKERVYLLIDKAQESIQDYLTFTSTFEPNLYLISDRFATFFKEQETNNLCDYLDEEYADWMQLYCEKAFEGQIQNGAIPVLNYISNHIRNQQAVNNFTKRAEVQLYELEGAQIILRAFFKTSSQFQTGLSDITLQENNFVLIITIIFLIYLSIFLFIVVCYLQQSLNQEYSILRRVVFLVPSQIMLGDDTFERCLKQIALNQGLK